jgi:TnpA family transposase
MPRRRSVTREQLEELLALPVAESELIRHWTLNAADLAVIERRRGDPNQLGFALQLCAFRYPGRLLRPREAISEPALDFVAGQLRVAPGVLADYAARHQTRREQLRALRAAFGFCMFAAEDRRELLAWLVPVALASTDAAAIAATLLDELRRRKIIAPGASVIERLVATAETLAERQVADQLTRGLLPAQAKALDALLTTRPEVTKRFSNTHKRTKRELTPPAVLGREHINLTGDYVWSAADEATKDRS